MGDPRQYPPPAIQPEIKEPAKDWPLSGRSAAVSRFFELQKELDEIQGIEPQVVELGLIPQQFGHRDAQLAGQKLKHPLPHGRCLLRSIETCPMREVQKPQQRATVRAGSIAEE